MAAREGLAEEEGERAVEEARVEGSLPDRPFTDLNDFLQFERSLETDAALQNVIRTLGTASTAPSSKEWVANSWHLVLSDDVGSLCSWKGIREKQCIRDLRITLAMRSAFVRKFGREEEFVEKTQLFFRGAQDRVKKKAQYSARRNQVRLAAKFAPLGESSSGRMSSAKKPPQNLKHVKSYSMEVEARDEISRSIRSSLRQSNIDKRRLINHEDGDESDSCSPDIMDSSLKVPSRPERKSPTFPNRKPPCPHQSDADSHSMSECGIFSQLDDTTSDSDCSFTSMIKDAASPTPRSPPKSPLKELVKKATVFNSKVKVPIELNEIPPKSIARLPPPIVISLIRDRKLLFSKLDELVKSDENLAVKNLSNDGIRVQCHASSSYRSLAKWLEDSYCNWHSWQLKEERTCKFFVRGLHKSTDMQYISEVFTKLGHDVKSVVNITNKEKKPLELFAVEILRKSNNKEVFLIKKIGFVIVTIELPKSRKGALQCYRCQRFGHSKTYCRNPPRYYKLAISPEKKNDSPAVSSLAYQNTEINVASTHPLQQKASPSVVPKVPSRKQPAHQHLAEFQNKLKHQRDSAGATMSFAAVLRRDTAEPPAAIPRSDPAVLSPSLNSRENSDVQQCLEAVRSGFASIESRFSIQLQDIRKENLTLTSLVEKFVLKNSALENRLTSLENLLKHLIN
ncbi:hypothetical protein ACLKA6_012824 [Drosophila palustris]